jgi:hypothetical protein
MADAEPRMWSFWRDKHGPVEALEDYYPETVASSPQLTAAVTQVKNGLLVIDAIMSEAEAEDFASD